MRTTHQSDAARHLAESLSGHPALSAVLYPTAVDFPQHDLAKRQMAFGGTLLAIELRGGRAAAERFLAELKLARIATSLGGP